MEGGAFQREAKRERETVRDIREMATAEILGPLSRCEVADKHLEGPTTTGGGGGMVAWWGWRGGNLGCNE